MSISNNYSQYQEYWDNISFGNKSTNYSGYLPILIKPDIKRVKTSSGFLYVGPLPDIKDLEKQGSFDIIWNLAWEWSYYAEVEKSYAGKVLCALIDDFCAPDEEELFFNQLEEVVDCLENGGKVFVHCMGGCGRTGTALTAIKGFLDNLSYKDALSFSKKEVGGPELMVQKAFLSEVFGVIQPDTYESDIASWLRDSKQSSGCHSYYSGE